MGTSLACINQVKLPIHIIVLAGIVAGALGAFGVSAAAPSEPLVRVPPAVGSRPAVAVVAANRQPEAPASEDLGRALSTLGLMQRTYRHLDDVTITEGPTPDGHQAVSYYRRGEIVVNPSHSASVEDIIAHEVWHVIDWRDNGRLDWGEAIPPDNRADYLR